MVKSNGESELIELPIVGYVSPDSMPLRHHSTFKKNNPKFEEKFIAKEIVFNPDAVPYAHALSFIGYMNLPNVENPP